MKPAYWVVIVFLALILLAMGLGKLPIWILAIYFAMSVCTFFFYAVDKSAATKDRWRTSENTLHGLALFGGWPGAMIAQQSLRHKSTKKTFQMIFWMTVAVNSGLLAWLAMSGWVASN